MMKKKSRGFAKRNSLGYILVGTLVVLLMLFCIIALTASIAPVVLSIHAGDAPAMMTMPAMFYCVFVDFILLEIIFLLFQPGAKDYIEDEQTPVNQDKKKMSGQVIIGIVCCVLLVCSIVTALGVCNVFTEDGMESYVFFKTNSFTWDEVVFYELEFSKESGLSLMIHLSKDKAIPLFGIDKIANQAFTEKYVDEYGFAGYLKELAIESDKTFKVKSPEAIEAYFKSSLYWEAIEKLIQ